RMERATRPQTLPSPDAAAPAAPQIGDYAIIGDCRTAALVSREGSIDWLCLPDFSDGSVFARLLDPANGGSFSIRPRQSCRASRRYIPETAVLETLFENATGAVRIIDLLPIQDGIRPMGPMREVLRVIEGLSGEVEITIGIDVRPDYGRCTPVLEHRGQLGWC